MLKGMVSTLQNIYIYFTSYNCSMAYDVKEPSEIVVSEIDVNGVHKTEHTTVTVCAHVLSVLYLLSFGLRGSPSLPVSFFCTLKKQTNILASL